MLERVKKKKVALLLEIHCLRQTKQEDRP